MTDLAMGGQTDAAIAAVSRLSQSKIRIANTVQMFFGETLTGLRPGGGAAK